MTVAELCSVLLLGLGVATELLCCVGLLAMGNAFDRLHYLGPASTVGPIAIATALLLDRPELQGDIKIVLIVLTLVLIGPVVTHVTGRAARVRQMGSVAARDTEREDRA